MSELKGQLLGMILVLAIFGAMAAVLVPTFQNMANRVESEASVSIPKSTKAVNVNVLG